MKRFVVIADIHLKLQDSLGVPINGYNSRLLDKVKSLTTSVNYAITTKADYFVILGDVYDKLNPSEKLRRVFRETIILPLVKAGIKIIYLMGNHDTNGEIVNLETEADIMQSFKPDSIKFITEPTIMDFKDTKIYFIPYGFEIPEDNQGCSIAMCHHGFTRAETGVGVIERSGEDIDISSYSKFSTIFSGHYHKPQELVQGNTRIVYVGSTNVWDFGERLDKKRFLELIAIAPQKIEVKSHKLVERDFLMLCFSEGDSWETSANVQDAVVKLEFTGTKTWYRSLDLAAIKRNYEGLGAHKVLITFKSVEEKRDNILDLQGTETEEAIVERYCRNKKIDKSRTELGLKILSDV
jgi:DNA repair exonuclease SbcCD nuclease subunit